MDNKYKFHAKHDANTNFSIWLHCSLTKLTYSHTAGPIEKS